MAVTVHSDPAAFNRFKTRIQGLRSKTMENGCTEAEALLAAAKEPLKKAENATVGTSKILIFHGLESAASNFSLK